MIASVAEPLQARPAKILWLAVAALLALCLLHSQCGCAGPRFAPVHVDVPTAATVDRLVAAPARQAQASNDQVLRLAEVARKTGIAAGSATAEALFQAATQNHLHQADVLTGADTLTQQLVGARQQASALEKQYGAAVLEVAAQKERADHEKARGDQEHARANHWRRWCILGALLAEVLVSLAGAKLQAWSRAAEAAALHGAEDVARWAGSWVMKIPVVAKWVLKLLALAAAFL